MIHIYLKYDIDFGYQVFKQAQTKNYSLQNLYFFLAGWSQDMLDLNKLTYANNLEWIEIEKNEENNEIVIWSQICIKKAIKFHDFLPQKEALSSLNVYYLYVDRRWAEIKNLTISFSNYNQILDSWKKIKEENPLYIVFSLDESNDLDKVSLIGKNELSKEDLENMQRDHEEYLRWQKALQLYNSDHEIVDDLWRSPADSVYDVDIAMYLDRSEGFVKHKTYTKSDVITDLQEKLKKGEPVYLVIHWLRVRMVYGVVDSDSVFEDLLRYFANMDDGYPEMISREKLQEIADRLSLGQDVVLD